MKKIDSFTNKYSLSKTLRFKLIPVGKTLENYEKSQMLAEDERLAERYAVVKGFIDRYHKEYIESVLSKITELNSFNEYAGLYYKTNKSEADRKTLEDLEESMSDPHSIVIVEWANTVENLLPENCMRIEIKYNDDNTREVNL